MESKLTTLLQVSTLTTFSRTSPLTMKRLSTPNIVLYHTQKIPYGRRLTHLKGIWLAYSKSCQQEVKYIFWINAFCAVLINYTMLGVQFVAIFCNRLNFFIYLFLMWIINLTKAKEWIGWNVKIMNMKGFAMLMTHLKKKFIKQSSIFF